MRVEVTASGSLTSTAYVSASTFKELGATWGCYLILNCCKLHHSRVFRLEIDNKLAENNDSRVCIDHWPSCSKDTSVIDCIKICGEMKANVMAPSDQKIVQCLVLAPEGDQIKLALPFVKSLLRNRILTGQAGSLTLQCDGLAYGDWSYRAYFLGQLSNNKVVAFEGGLVTDKTLILILPSATSLLDTSSLTKHMYQPVGAHGQKFRVLVAMALQMTSMSSTNASVRTIEAFHSILLHAPSGAGKTTLVYQIAKEFGVNLLLFDGGLLASSQLRLEDFFSAALRIQPCVLLLENLELLFPMIVDESKYKLVCQFVRCLDSIQKEDSARIAVIGTVTELGILHTKVRQLFMEEVFLDAPDKLWTMELLISLLPSTELLRQEFLMSLTIRYGQKPSNIVSIAQQICSHLSNMDTKQISMEILEPKIAASAREISCATVGTETFISSVPHVSWDDIGGLERVKHNLIEMVVWPLEKPHVFCRMGISPPSGIMLHGPPGTGKTMLAKAAAKASGCNFLNLSASDLMKAEVGESEKAISRVFDTARALSPCMIFIDEFQSIFGNRLTAGQTTSRMISQLLIELDTLKAVSDVYTSEMSAIASNCSEVNRTFVVAATNALSAIDPAFLQPGRFENVVYVGLPNADERKAILEIQRNKMPWSQDVHLSKLVEETNGANAASLIAICQFAALQAMQRIPSDAPDEEQCISMVDFVAALAKENYGFSIT